MVVDVETGGFNAQTDAILEIAASILYMDDFGRLKIAETIAANIEPFDGAIVDPRSLEFTGIDLNDSSRNPVAERDALEKILPRVRKEVKITECQRAILVGHNPSFDLSFMNAAIERVKYKRNPFHPFSTFDTATLGGLAYGQTVLARAVQAAGIEWDESKAHSAKFDTIKTAELFCKIVNLWSLKAEI